MADRPKEPDFPDHYANLELYQNATPRDVKVAYMRLAKFYHPDKLGAAETVDAEQFRKVGAPP
jgi:curved DNA-binding protein CbpA